MKPETAKAIKDLGDLSALVASAYSEATKGVLPRRPEGYFSTKDYCEKVSLIIGHELPEATARGQLRSMKRKGKVETVKAYEDSGDGRVRIMTFYREIAK